MYEIRSVKIQDLTDERLIAQLKRLHVRSSKEQSYMLMIFEELLRQRNGKVHSTGVATYAIDPVSGKPVAWVLLHTEDFPRRRIIANAYVSIKHRRKGLGTNCFLQAMRHRPDKRIKSVIHYAHTLPGYRMFDKATELFKRENDDN